MDTSFGKLEILLKQDKKIISEYLIFERSGRKHRHLEFESFTVLSGQGKVYCGENVYEVKEGDTVTIPPKTDHWMEPKENQILIGILWYHDHQGSHY